MRAAKTVYTQQTIPALGKIQALLGQIRDKARESVISEDAMLSAARSTRRNVLILVVFAAVFGLGVAVLVSRGITRAMRNISDGIEEAASNVASAAAQVGAASLSLADGAAQQASSVEQTSVSLKEITIHGKETAGLTEGAEQLMNRNIEKSAEALKSRSKRRPPVK